MSKRRKAVIESFAKEMHVKFNISNPPVDPKRITMQLACIYNFSDPDEIGFTIYKNGAYSVYINTIEYYLMSTWTYAHECGHIVLNHAVDFAGFINIPEIREYLDQEANAFAAELLMPTAWIKDYANKYPPNVSTNLGKLVSIFGVSWESLINRLHSLGIQEKEISRGILSRYSCIEGNFDTNLAVAEAAVAKDY